MNLPKEGIDPYLASLAELEPESIELIIAPPYPYLAQVHALVATLGLRASVSAQNCSDQKSGAFTGEVAADMVNETGAKYVIVGHSERRTLFGETDQIVARKLAAVMRSELTPILCVGEDEKTRIGGGTSQLLERQLQGALSTFGRENELVVAYEPLWAIGTGRNATPEIAAEAHELIRERLSGLGFHKQISVIYGGSVTPENAFDLAEQKQIDGFLVGGASLSAAKFKGIFEQMQRAQVTEP